MVGRLENFFFNAAPIQICLLAAPRHSRIGRTADHGVVLNGGNASSGSDAISDISGHESSSELGDGQKRDAS